MREDARKHSARAAQRARSSTHLRDELEGTREASDANDPERVEQRRVLREVLHKGAPLVVHCEHAHLLRGGDEENGLVEAVARCDVGERR